MLDQKTKFLLRKNVRSLHFSSLSQFIYIYMLLFRFPWSDILSYCSFSDTHYNEYNLESYILHTLEQKQATSNIAGNMTPLLWLIMNKCIYLNTYTVWLCVQYSPPQEEAGQGSRSYSRLARGSGSLDGALELCLGEDHTNITHRATHDPLKYSP